MIMKFKLSEGYSDVTRLYAQTVGKHIITFNS